MRRVLVITDRTDAAWVASVPAEFRPDVSFEVLSLGTEPDVYRSEHAARLARLPAAEVIDVRAHSDAAREEVIAFLPTFLFEAVRRTDATGESVLSALAVGDRNLWWLTETAEKSPTRGPFVRQLYFLALAARVWRQAEWEAVLIAVNDAGIAATLEQAGARVIVTGEDSMRRRLASSPFISRAATFLRYAGAKLVLRAAGLAGTRLEQPSAAIFTRYPVLWSKPYDASAAAEVNFGSLPSELDQRIPVHYAAVLSIGPAEVWRRRHQIRAVAAARRIIFVESLISFRQVAACVLGRAQRVAVRRLSKLGAEVWTARFAGFDLTALWKREVARALASANVPGDWMRADAFASLSSGGQLRMVIHPCEFQPMEKAIWYGIDRSTRSVAFQHAAIARATLANFFAPGEIAWHLAAQRRLACPMPDLLLVSGRFQESILLEAGFPRSRLGLSGAVRYQALARARAALADRAAARQQLSIAEGAPHLLVLTSSERADAIRLVETVASAANHAPGLHIVFKCHYHARIELEIRRAMASGANEWKVLDVDAPLHAHICSADAVVLTNSTVGLEAMALGTVPIVLQTHAAFDPSPLLDTPGAAIVVSDAMELGAVLGHLAEGDLPVQALAAHWPAAVDRAFAWLDGRENGRFIGYLQSTGLLETRADVCA